MAAAVILDRLRWPHPLRLPFFRCGAGRLVRLGVVDMGGADPLALGLARAATDTYVQLGSPVGELALANTVIYLATAPKSNAAYTA